MRAGEDPGAVFDALRARGQITTHRSEMQRHEALADQVATARNRGVTAAVVVDTREHAATLNAAIRDRLVAGRTVDAPRTDAGGGVFTEPGDDLLRRLALRRLIRSRDIRVQLGSKRPRLASVHRRPR